MPGKRYILVTMLIVGCLLGVFLFRAPEAPQLEGGIDSSRPAAPDTAAVGQSVEQKHSAENTGSSDTADRPGARVKWRPRPYSVLQPADYLSRSYAELRSLAEAGDGRAAAWLAALLAQCSSFPPPQPQDEIDAAITEMRRTHLVPVYSNGATTWQDFNNHLESLEAAIEIFSQRAKTCRDVPVAHRDDWEVWAGHALAIGHLDDLTHTLLADSMEKDDYAQLIDDLWDSGEPTALLTLSAMNLLDYHNGINPRGQVMQLAYQLAALALVRDYERGLDATYGGFDLAAVLVDDIQYSRGQMHPHEILEAENLAEELLENNENCCLVWPHHFYQAD